MPTPLFALLVLAGAALYFMKPDERRHLAQAASVWLRRTAREVRDGREPYDELDAQLLARTPRLIVTPAIALTWIVVWIGLRMSAAAPADALVAWGANYTPRTTAGEWWRLLTYAFVHDSLLAMLAAIAALVAIGMVVERLVGRTAFASVFVAAALAAGVVTLWTSAATQTTWGACGGVCGIIGLLAAVAVYGYTRAPRLPLSAVASKRIGAGCLVFLVLAPLTGSLSLPAALAALMTGLAAGLLLARGVVEHRSRIGRSLAVAGAVALLTFVTALPLRGTIDARPEIARVADVETRTASDYAKAVDAYTHGRLKAKELAQLIEKNILPALAADRARIDALRGVPREQAPLVAAAREYFELRDTSWRRRVDGLRGSSMKVLRDADRAERAALDAFERMQKGTADGS